MAKTCVPGWRPGPQRETPQTWKSTRRGILWPYRAGRRGGPSARRARGTHSWLRCSGFPPSGDPRRERGRSRVRREARRGRIQSEPRSGGVVSAPPRCGEGTRLLLAPLPVQNDRYSLEAEPLPQTTLQVTYIILDPISRIVHIESERRRLGRGLRRIVELEVPSRRRRRGTDAVQDVLDRLVQLRRGDLPRVLLVDPLAGGQDFRHPGARLGGDVEPRRVLEKGIHPRELLLDQGPRLRRVLDQVPLVEDDDDRLGALLGQGRQARLLLRRLPGNVHHQKHEVRPGNGAESPCYAVKLDRIVNLGLPPHPR